MNRPVSLLLLSKDEELSLIEEFEEKGYRTDESNLLAIIENGTTGDKLVTAVLLLGLNGSDRSVSLLKSLAFHPNEDVRATAVLSIAKISGAKSTSFLASLLLDKKFKPKVYAMAALWEVGDESAVSAVSAFADTLLVDDTNDIDWSNDPLYVIEYLQKYALKEADRTRCLQLEAKYKRKNRSLVGYIRNLIGLRK